MNYIEHKQVLLKFCHLSDLNVNPIGDSAHVKILISFQTVDKICMSTDSHAPRM